MKDGKSPSEFRHVSSLELLWYRRNPWIWDKTLDVKDSSHSKDLLATIWVRLRHDLVAKSVILDEITLQVRIYFWYLEKFLPTSNMATIIHWFLFRLYCIWWRRFGQYWLVVMQQILETWTFFRNNLLWISGNFALKPCNYRL